MENKHKMPVFEGKLFHISETLVDLISKYNEYRLGNKKFSKVIAYASVYQEFTQTKMKTLTGYSRGTISNILNALIDQKLLLRRKDPLTKEYIYSTGGTVLQASRRVIESTGSNFVADRKEFFKNLEEELRESDLEDKEGYDKIFGFVSEMNRVYPLLEKVTMELMVLFKKLTEEGENQFQKEG